MAYCKWLTELSSQSGQAAKLSKLLKAGHPVAPGFIVTEKSFENFVKQRKIDFPSREAFLNTSLDTKMAGEIAEFYKYIDADEELKNLKSAQALLQSAVRDLPFVSVKCKGRVINNVKGQAQLCRAIQECWSTSQGEPVSVIVSKQPNAQKTGAIMPEKDKIVIKACYGQEIVSPNVYILDKEGKLKGIDLQNQQIQVVHDEYSSGVLKQAVPKEKQNSRVLNDTEINYLAKLAKEVESCLGSPHEIFWQMEKYKLYITDVREPPKQALAENQEPGHMVIVRLSGAPDYEGLKKELKSRKQVFVQVSSTDQLETLQEFAEEFAHLKILVPAYLEHLIDKKGLDRNKFLTYEDKNL